MKPRLLLFFFTAAAAGVACSGTTSPTFDGGGSSGGVNSGSGSGSTGGGGSSAGNSGGSSGGAMGGLGDACTVPTNGGADPCAAAGYACTATSPGASAGSCELPGLDDSCLPNVGCAAGNTCLEDSTSPVEYACFQTCASTLDCTLLSSSCQMVGTQMICNANTCGPGLPSGYPTSGPDFYAPCNAAGTGDGLCLPYDESGIGTIGLCFAEGPADAGAPSSCSLNRVDGGALCPFDTFCLPDTTSGKSACLPLCQSGGPDGGPACAADAYCLGLQGGLYFGFCLADCSATSTCPANQSCQSIAADLDAGTVCAP